MKKIIILPAIAALALTSACNIKTEFPPLSSENGISLDLVYGEPGTKSDGTVKENKVTSVDYFFYADPLENPVYSYRDNNPTLSSDLKYNISLTAGETAEGGLVPTLQNLFKDGKFELFAVFNAPQQISAAPLATVKQTAVEISYAYLDEGGNPKNAWHVTPENDPVSAHPRYFVMTGQQTVRKASSGDYANVKEDVKMKRLAAKIAVTLSIASQKTDELNRTWVPLLGGNNVRLYMCNFATNAVIGAADELPLFPSTITQADYDPYVLDTDNQTASSGNYTIPSKIEFYTYPMEWEAGSYYEPYFKLVLPWRTTGGYTTQKEIYYKIMLPNNVTSLKANTAYQLTANITLNGNETTDLVEITASSAIVKGWNTDSNVNSAVSDAKYLSVEKEDIVFYTSSTGITFAASGPVSVTITEVSQKNLRTGSTDFLVQNNTINADVRTDITNKQLIGPSGAYTGFSAGGEEWISLDNQISYLTVGHELDSDLESPHLDVTPWVYKVKLHLVGESDSYDREVTFTQEPQLLVAADPNSNINPSTGLGRETALGIFINGVGNSNSRTGTSFNTGRENAGWGGGGNGTWPQLDLGGANGLASSQGSSPGNRNPNMYVITSTVSKNYVIGDPRTTDVSVPEFRYRPRNNYNWVSSYASAPAMEEESDRILTYYHPTATENTSEMIAPIIRVASSYGVCVTGRSRQEAILRCATYQEDGIPAGRWRLPTYAEVEYITNLSILGRIPYLFGQSSNNGQTPTNNNSHYWTANGLIEVNNGSSTGTNRHVTRLPEATESSYDNESVRCVYDEWFWGDATTRPVDKGTFTWGDRDY